MMSGVRASSTRIEVHFVDDGVVVSALDHRRDRILHVVAQIVEAEFVVGPVGHVAGVGRLALLVGETVHDAADGEAQEAIDLAHPIRVAAGEIVVHGDDVDAETGQRVQIDGQGGDERLAFARPHLRDVAAVEHHAAHELDVEMALAERALGRLADGCESFRQDVVQIFAAGQTCFKRVRHRPQFGVGLGLELVLERVDFLDALEITPELPLVGGTEESLRDSA